MKISSLGRDQSLASFRLVLAWTLFSCDCLPKYNKLLSLILPESAATEMMSFEWHSDVTGSSRKQGAAGEGQETL